MSFAHWLYKQNAQVQRVVDDLLLEINQSTSEYARLYAKVPDVYRGEFNGTVYCDVQFRENLMTLLGFRHVHGFENPVEMYQDDETHVVITFMMAAKDNISLSRFENCNPVPSEITIPCATLVFEIGAHAAEIMGLDPSCCSVQVPDYSLPPVMLPHVQEAAY